MTLIKHKLAAATAVAAAFSLLATPAAAIELPRVAGQQAVKAGELEVENRRHRGRGHRGWDRRDRIDAGDVLTGVLILGGIAAIASAASKPRQTDRYPDYEDRADYRAPAADRWESRGIERAVDMCVAEVERGGSQVASVDSANRDAAGWRVAGELGDGAQYWCTIDNSGQVSGVGGAGSGYGEPLSDAQYDEDYYANARAARGGVDGDLEGQRY